MQEKIIQRDPKQQQAFIIISTSVKKKLIRKYLHDLEEEVKMFEDINISIKLTI